MVAPTVNFKRVARLTGFAVLAFAVGLLFVNFILAWIHTSWLVHVPCSGTLATLPETDSEEVVFESRDEITLRGWFIRGTTQPETVIIVQPGYGSNTQAALPDAQILYDAGYSIFLAEHRSCSETDIPSGLGILEANDMLGAVDYLTERENVEKIGGLGFSAGGTALMLAAARDDRIEAVIIQGALDDFRSDVLGDPPPHNPLERIYRQTIYWMVQARLDVEADEMRPYAEVGDVSPRAIFFIFGEFEPPRVSQALLEAAGEPTELWIVPGAGHGGYQYAAPGEYEERLTAFFAEAF